MRRKLTGADELLEQLDHFRLAGKFLGSLFRDLRARAAWVLRR
jgi:hypothetical protein